MNILVLQHADIEHPGIFRKFLKEDGHSWHSCHLNNGDTIPSINNYDALWVLGGPMDTWEEEKYPWLIDEKKFIKEAVQEKGIPFLGLCLGHQLLSEALGSKCGPAKKSEIGVMNVQLTEDGKAGILFDGFPDEFKCLQWHGAEVQSLPLGSKCLARSRDCQIQAMSWGTRAYSMQFHVEVEGSTVQDWNSIETYSKALKLAMGKKGPEILKQACENEMEKFNQLAERLYINWLQTAAHT